jgi:hypothetical protein
MLEELCSQFSHILSTNAKKFLVYEWFYSIIDYQYFSKNEYDECLKDLNLSHIQKLTRYEWSQIRSGKSKLNSTKAIGKPRRFSKNFLKSEKEKLEKNRTKLREKVKNFVKVNDRVMVWIIFVN